MPSMRQFGSGFANSGMFRLNTFFIGDKSVRDSVEQGDADYTPIFLSEIPESVDEVDEGMYHLKYQILSFHLYPSKGGDTAG